MEASRGSSPSFWPYGRAGYPTSDPGGEDPGLSSGCSGAALGVPTLAGDPSITLTATASTEGVIFGFVARTFFRSTFFAPARLGLTVVKRFFAVA